MRHDCTHATGAWALGVGLHATSDTLQGESFQTQYSLQNFTRNLKKYIIVKVFIVNIDIFYVYLFQVKKLVKQTNR